LKNLVVRDILIKHLYTCSGIGSAKSGKYEAHYGMDHLFGLNTIMYD